MSGLINRTSKRSIVRVVPLASGAASQVRLALDKWFSPGTLRVVEPNDAASIQQVVAPTTTATGGGSSSPAAGAAPAGGGSAGQTAPAATGSTAPPAAAASSPSPSSGGSSSENYIILIGEPKWVDAGEAFAREVDQKIADARLAAQEKSREQRAQFHHEQIQEAADLRNAQEELIKSTMPVTKAYTVQNGKASDLKDTVTTQATVPQVSLVASPKDSMSQVIVCQGTESSVNRMMALLQQLDTGSEQTGGSTADELFSYDVKFSDPRALREAIVSQVPGIRATLPPNTVGNSALFKEAQEKQQAADVSSQNTAAGQNAQSSQSTTATSATGGTGAVSTTSVSDADFELPFAKEEGQAVPMRLILRGSHAQIQLALRYLEVLDIAPKQVAIELRVMDLSKQDAINAGIDWNILTGGAVKIINLNNAQSSPSNSVGVSLSGSKFNGDVTASLDRIASNTNLIARPNLLAIDGRQSEIFVGDIVRYVESITTSQNGPTITTGEVPVGVRLSVLPRVGADGNLTLDLRPRVSILDSFTAVTGGGELPQTSSRMAQSTISVRSGETIAIGGLIQDQDVKNMSGIPILMDLPFLGHLFRKTSTTKQRSEVVIFLTARAIDGPVGSEMKLPIQDEMSGSHKGGKK
jgi:type II secretory pathway component GspD/PulD (secretin)